MGNSYPLQAYVSTVFLGSIWFLQPLQAATRSGHFQGNFADTKRHPFLLTVVHLWNQVFTRAYSLALQFPRVVASWTPTFLQRIKPRLALFARSIQQGKGRVWARLPVPEVSASHEVDGPHSETWSFLPCHVCWSHLLCIPFVLPMVPTAASLSQATGQKLWPNHGVGKTSWRPPAPTPQKGCVQFSSRKFTV